jgi:membrane fusion protein, multidrug efflux system
MKKRLLTAAVLLVAGGAFYYFAFGSTGPQPERPGAGAAVKSRRAPIAVITAAVEKTDFPVRRRTIGTLESPASVVIKARLDSQVATQHITDGQMVKKGDLLFTLDDREVRAAIARTEATIEKDRANVAKTEADLKRVRELAARNVASRQSLDQTVAEHKAALATLAGDQAQLEIDRVRLSFTQIKAPIAGRVGAVLVTPGNLVKANDDTGLVTITQIAPIRVAFTLPERDLTALRAARARDQSTAVRVYRSGETTPLATGKLNFIDSAVDTASGTITAKATFANAELTLWPGQYVDVEIDLDLRADTIVIPTVAIQSGQKGPYVFVAKPDRTVAVRYIKPLGNVDNSTAIASGLKAGDRVVVEGQVRLADGARITERDPEQASRAAASD